MEMAARETAAYEIALLGPDGTEAAYAGYARVRVAAEECGHDGDLIRLPEIDFPRVEGEAGPRAATAFSLRLADGQVFCGPFWLVEAVFESPGSAARGARHRLLSAKGGIPLLQYVTPRLVQAQVNTKGDGA